MKDYSFTDLNNYNVHGVLATTEKSAWNKLLSALNKAGWKITEEEMRDSFALSAVEELKPSK